MELQVGNRIRVNKGSNIKRKIGERGTITNISYERNRVILEIQFDRGDLIVVDPLNLKFDTWSDS